MGKVRCTECRSSYSRDLKDILAGIRATDYDVPTEGMQIGERMAWLKEQTKEGAGAET